MNVHLNNIIAAQTSAGSGLRILVFKTNLRLKKDVRQMAFLFSQETGILRWNIDTHDIDKVLRIETTCLTGQDIIALVRAAGYCCEELPD
jgi:hypothetical protein